MPGQLLDANVWVAAAFSAHPRHEVARSVLLACTPAKPALFCRATQLSFLRLATTPLLLKAYGAVGVTNRDALVLLAAFGAMPMITFREEPRGTTDLWHELADRPTASPKVWMDAFLAAFAISGALEMVTLDRDFRAYEPRGIQLRLLT